MGVLRALKIISSDLPVFSALSCVVEDFGGPKIQRHFWNDTREVTGKRWPVQAI